MATILYNKTNKETVKHSDALFKLINLTLSHEYYPNGCGGASERSVKNLHKEIPTLVTMPYGGNAHCEARADVTIYQKDLESLSKYFERCNFNNAAKLCLEGDFEVIVTYDGRKVCGSSKAYLTMFSELGFDTNKYVDFTTDLDKISKFKYGMEVYNSKYLKDKYRAGLYAYTDAPELTEFEAHGWNYAHHVYYTICNTVISYLLNKEYIL